MLKTKDDINAQKGKVVQLADSDTPVKKPSFFQNPKIVYYTFIFTIIFSTLLWLVSEFKKGIHIKSINLKFPQINFPKSDINFKPSVESLVSHYLSESNGIWSLYVQTDKVDYQKNSTQFNLPLSQLKTELINLPDKPNQFTIDLLPQGLNIIEKITETDQVFEIDLVINLPTSKQYYIFIKNSSFSDLSLVKNQLREFIPQLYWHLAKSD